MGVCPARAANHAPNNRSARACPSRSLDHRSVFPIPVARGPVPRERSRVPGTAGDRSPPYGRRASPTPVGQERLLLTRWRSGDRKLQRGSARVCPARAANHAPKTVARGPVPRERLLYHGHGGGQAPALREEGACFDFRSARACPSRTFDSQSARFVPRDAPICSRLLFRKYAIIYPNDNGEKTLCAFFVRT